MISYVSAYTRTIGCPRSSIFRIVLGRCMDTNVQSFCNLACQEDTKLPRAHLSLGLGERRSIVARHGIVRVTQSLRVRKLHLTQSRFGRKGGYFFPTVKAGLLICYSKQAKTFSSYLQASNLKTHYKTL